MVMTSRTRRGWRGGFAGYDAAEAQPMRVGGAPSAFTIGGLAGEAFDVGGDAAIVTAHAPVASDSRGGEIGLRGRIESSDAP